VPDERTVRYYVTLALLDRPSAMRGRTALYGPRHVAQVVAIKRLQTMGRSLSEIQALWPTLDDPTLARMSGVALPAAAKPAARTEFWKREPRPGDAAANSDAGSRARELDADAVPAGAATPGRPAESTTAASAERSPGAPTSAAGTVELRIELAPQIVLSLSVVDDSVTVSPADVRAIRAAAAPLLAELASRRLASHPGGTK
jgi:DNA-binding transcriptional MerR regulator